MSLDSNYFSSDKEPVRPPFEETSQRIHAILRASVPEAFQAQTSNMDAGFTPEEAEAHRQKVLDLNPECTDGEIFIAKKWGLKEFSKPNLPVVLGELEHTKAFSTPKGIRVLDMPLRMPGEGWRIPPELAQFEEVIREAAAHEKMLNPHYEDCYCYVTIDQKVVEPDMSQRRAGWHTDAFVTDSTGVQIDVLPENMARLGYKDGEEADRTYIVADRFPTAFLKGPFDLSAIPREAHEQVEQTFMEVAQHKEPFSYPPYTLIRLDPFVVHTAVPNTTGEPQQRTFIKIAFSRYKYNRQGNTHNGLFDYQWPMVARIPGERGHRNSIIGQIPEGHENFLAVDPSVLFEPNTDLNSIDWVEGSVFKIQKIEKVSMRLAEEGESVATKAGEFLISENIAPKGSVIVTNPKGQSYCLSRAQFKRFYDPKPDENGLYTPAQRPKTVIKVTRDVKLYGPWGGMQYVQAGSALVVDDKYDLYAIHSENLQSSYQLV